MSYENGFLKSDDLALQKVYYDRSAEACCAYFLQHLKPTFTILDVGCGPGNITIGLAHQVPEGKVVGVDISPGVIAQATASYPQEAHPNLTFEVADAHELSQFPDASFDVVHAHALITHCRDPVAALKALKRVCKPGGLVATRDNAYPMRLEDIKPDVPGLQEGADILYKYMSLGGVRTDVGLHKEGWAREAFGHDVKLEMSESLLVIQTDLFFLEEGSHGEQLCIAKGIATKETLAERRIAWNLWLHAPGHQMSTPMIGMVYFKDE